MSKNYILLNLYRFCKGTGKTFQSGGINVWYEFCKGVSIFAGPSNLGSPWLPTALRTKTTPKFFFGGAGFKLVEEISLTSLDFLTVTQWGYLLNSKRPSIWPEQCHAHVWRALKTPSNAALMGTIFRRTGSDTALHPPTRPTRLCWSPEFHV